MKADTLDRMVLAVEKVRERVGRVCRSLNEAEIPFALVGGNAVAAWVAQVDPGAVRNTQDVDILLRRADLNRASQALSHAGFFYRHARGLDRFLDGPEGRARDAVHVIFAEEKVLPDSLGVAPDVNSVVKFGETPVVNLPDLVEMKLISFRLKDRVHLLDMLEVGLIDEQWTARFPDALAGRLQQLIDNPDQ